MRRYCVGRSPAAIAAAPMTSGMRAPVDSPRKIIGRPRAVATFFTCPTFEVLTSLLEAPITVKSLDTMATSRPSTFA